MLPERLAGPVAAASGDNTVYTVPDNHRVEITRVKIVNNSAAKVTVKVGINGSSDADLVFPEIGVPAKGMVDQETYDVLKAVDSSIDTLVVNADAVGVTVTVSGIDNHPRL